MRNIRINERTRGIRPASYTVLREICRLACRNKSGFGKLVRRILDTIVVKTITFAATNRACGDKTVLKLPEQTEAESTR